MPNFVYSSFEVTGDAEELDRFKLMMFKPVPPSAPEVRGSLQREMAFDFARIIPAPDSDEIDLEEWAVLNWGTKWNALDLDWNGVGEQFIRFQFTTAWDFPTPVFRALAAEFPTLVFDGAAYEEGDAFKLEGQFNGSNCWRFVEPR